METINLTDVDFPYEIVEGINTLRTNVQFAGHDKKVILVTSCIQHEGKSTVSLELATSLANLDKNVLLLDADLRASTFINRVEGSKPSLGLSHLLSGQAKLSDVVYRTNRRGLYAIFAGPTPPKPTDLFSSQIFSNAVAELRKVYDYIIIDSAPLGAVVDAAIIAKNCDASILIVESGTSKYKFVQKVKDDLETTGCPIIGAVLTKVKINKHSPYYSRYYGYGYGKENNLE